MNVVKHNGSSEPFDMSKIRASLVWAKDDDDRIDLMVLENASKIQFFDGISTSYINDIFISTARSLSSLREPWWEKLEKNLMVQKLYKQVGNGTEPLHISKIITRAKKLGKYGNSSSTFSKQQLDRLNNTIDYSRDFNFTASGLASLQSKYMKFHDAKSIELPQHMYMAMSMDGFYDYHLPREPYIDKLYEALSTFKITLPTPEMTALRSPSTDYASCVLLNIGDSLDSWNAGTEAIVNHTAASAGIGIDIAEIASIGDLVKNGQIIHGGKVPEIQSIEKDVNKATQNGRRGSGTAFINFFDPEIINIMSLKSPRTEVGKRVNDLSYGVKLNKLVYDRARRNQPLSLFSTRAVARTKLLDLFYSSDILEFIKLYEQLESEDLFSEQISARDFVEMLNQECFENSSYYPINIDEINTNTPYVEQITQSNICVEEVSPTKPISKFRPNDPDIAICVLGNINQGLVSIDDLPDICDLLVRLQTHIMVRQKHPTSQANAYVDQYRSIGIGVSNHAFWLANNGLKYGSDEALYKFNEWMEHFQYNLIKASMNLAKEIGSAPRFWEYSTYAKGIMPIDRYNKNVDKLVSKELHCDWETLRSDVMEHGMANVALSMIPPSESSAGPSNQTTALEGIKNLITYKEGKSALLKEFAPDFYRLADKYDYAYDTPDYTRRYLMHIAVAQKWLCKAISTNRFYNPELYENEKVKLAHIIADMYFAKRYGIKTLYYVNTKIPDAESTDKQSCQGGGCDV